ncbi:hypothetical protein RFI_10183 [Reticulomyxa filosa]|uniref:Uncharacterized protein n=1 Tax=Reticulomyxa filosa TaxID=46433 RepID=X6NNK8_RETFI|nr:hypothetical protein RFI_10183 [Reticulomyxa filosa]|eukprot:ETO26952.1 hypothetical protein RFI_10183 [Reticulomyxa filosa]
MGSIVVSLNDIDKTPKENTLEHLYFENESSLAECVVFEIMGADVDALVLMLHQILSGSNNLTKIGQKILQLFIILTSYNIIDSLFRYNNNNNNNNNNNLCASYSIYI